MASCDFPHHLLKDLLTQKIAYIQLVNALRKDDSLKTKAVNDWASLPSELKRLLPKSIFNYKLKQIFSI